MSRDELDKKYKISTIIANINKSLDKIDRDDLNDIYDDPNRDNLKIALLDCLDRLAEDGYF